MFRIRSIHEDLITVDQGAIREVQTIWREQFPAVSQEEIDALPDRLCNPFKQSFCSILFVAEDSKGQVVGFALLMHEPQLKFCFLDYLASARGIRGRGIGAALYEHVRKEALSLNAKLFFECPPDDPMLCPDPHDRKANASRLRFYERYGARPIIHTDYDTPVNPMSPPGYVTYLMYDPLDRSEPLRAADAQQVVRAILERKYRDMCPQEYVEMVVRSFQEDPVQLRPRRLGSRSRPQVPSRVAVREPIAVCVSDRHHIHHIRERGYVESPVRIKAILSELYSSGLIQGVPVRDYPIDHITAVHDPHFVEFLETACAGAPEGKSIYPYVFPIRNVSRPPRELSIRAGYYCIDTFTPINQQAYPAAVRAVDCTMTAADEVLQGRRVAYALVRPPGHHAEHRFFGGFCYFNNAAIAAHYLSQHGKVAILDVDYHHGNGQQEIFYDRNDIFTVSLHGDPDFAYPYFSGFADERGRGLGEGFNLNMPLPEILAGPEYRLALVQAIDAIRAFQPAYLVIALGLDPARGDPTGTWLLTGQDFHQNGRLIGQLHLPTLVVQEGGYRTQTLGINARHFFQGLVEGLDRE